MYAVDRFADSSRTSPEARVVPLAEYSAGGAAAETSSLHGTGLDFASRIVTVIEADSNDVAFL
jgi:hypothetical protein